MLLTPFQFHHNFGGLRCTRSPMLGSVWAGALSYSGVKLFSKYSNLCDHGTWTLQTDRQRDRQTTYSCMTALCLASCGKNYTQANYVVNLAGQLDGDFFSARCRLPVHSNSAGARELEPPPQIQLWVPVFNIEEKGGVVCAEGIPRSIVPPEMFFF